MGRAPCCQKVGLKKGKWTSEEDQILCNYIQANGEGSWRSLPKNAGLLRCGKSCRLRWMNYLRTDIKRGNISVEEENTIVKLHASFGSRWSLIASHLPGRTDNEIKNYWNSHLSRKIYSFQGTNVKEIITLPPKRKRGRTSRFAMMKNKTYSQKGEKLYNFSSSNVHTTTQEENIGPTLVQGENEINDNMLEPFKDVINNEEEELSFDDIIMDNCWEEASWDLSLSPFVELERERNDDMIRTERGDTCGNNMKMVSLNDQGLNYSPSSIVSFLEDDNWDWESVVQFDHMDQSVLRGEDLENMLNWLCEDEE